MGNQPDLDDVAEAYADQIALSLGARRKSHAGQNLQRVVGYGRGIKHGELVVTGIKDVPIRINIAMPFEPVEVLHAKRSACHRRTVAKVARCHAAARTQQSQRQNDRQPKYRSIHGKCRGQHARSVARRACRAEPGAVDMWQQRAPLPTLGSMAALDEETRLAQCYRELDLDSRRLAALDIL